MDVLNTSITTVRKTISEVVYTHATDDLISDWAYCDILKDDQIMRRILAHDIIYRVNVLVPGTFADLTLQNTGVLRCLHCGVSSLYDGECTICGFSDKFDTTAVIKRSYKPSSRFVKILKSLARKGGADLDEKEVEILELIYHDCVTIQCEIRSGSLLNIYYTILKLTESLLPIQKHIAIRKVIRLPKSRTLVGYDKRWQKICKLVPHVVYKPTDPMQYTTVVLPCGREIVIE